MEQRNKISSKWLLLAGVAGFGGLLAAATPAAAIPAGWTCAGVCGTLGPDGVVTAPPQFGPNYQFITTADSGGAGAAVANGASLNIGTETNGTLLTTNSFALKDGDKLSFFFNYVTSDGATFVEYAWAGLQNLGTSLTEIIFTARTTTSGDTVPGNGLPGLSPNASLTPASTPIIPGATTWSPLGGSSGLCFQGPGQGCGSTDWIKTDYIVPTGGAGNYQLLFGVVNWDDLSFDTGLAIAGTTINDTPINPVPVPMSLALFGVGLLGLGAAARRRA